jgi:hypothetical protein
VHSQKVSHLDVDPVLGPFLERLDRFQEHRSHGVIERSFLSGTEATPATEWIDPGAPADLVGVCTANAGDKALPHEHVLDLAPLVPETLTERIEREVGVCGLWPLGGEGRDLVTIGDQVYLAHVFGIVVAELEAVVEREDQGIAFAVPAQRRPIVKAPSEHRLYDQLKAVEEKDQVLATSKHTEETALTQVLCWIASQHIAHDDRAADERIHNRYAHDTMRQKAMDHF